VTTPYDEIIDKISSNLSKEYNLRKKLEIINKEIDNTSNYREIIESDNFPDTVWDEVENKTELHYKCMLICACSRDLIFPYSKSSTSS
jgi:hypothetical protein